MFGNAFLRGEPITRTTFSTCRTQYPGHRAGTRVDYFTVFAKRARDSLNQIEELLAKHIMDRDRITTELERAELNWRSLPVM